MDNNLAYILNLSNLYMTVIPYDTGNSIEFARRDNVGKDLHMVAVYGGRKYIQRGPLCALTVRNIGNNIDKRAIQVINTVSGETHDFTFSFGSYLCFLYNINDDKERMYLFREEEQIAVYEQLTNIIVRFVVNADQ